MPLHKLILYWTTYRLSNSTLFFSTWLKQAYKKDVNNYVIKNEAEQPIEDLVNSLIFAITKHFIEDPEKYREKIFVA